MSSMKLWRITNKGSWPLFQTDVEGENIMNAIDNFEAKQKKRTSVADRTNIISIILLGDSKE